MDCEAVVGAAEEVGSEAVAEDDLALPEVAEEAVEASAGGAVGKSMK